ncbi:MAG: hypothetical protein ABI867_19495 [Kofleriaceae bacterium]
MRHLGCWLLVVTACAGKAPPSTGGDDDPIDAQIIPELGQKVSGHAIDYFGAVPLADSTVTTDGIDPAKMTTTIADGSWELAAIPVGSKVFLSVAHASFRPTRNLATTVADVDVIQDLFATTSDDIRRQYTSLGRVPTGGTGVLIAELQNTDGTPLVGIPLANVTLTDALDQPVATAVGPFFFGPVDIDPLATVSTLADARSRVAFLDLAPGTFKLKVLDGGAAQIVTTFTSVADGTTLALSGGIPRGGGSGNITDPTFAQHIHPRLQKAALGGVGCGTCHTATGTGAILVMDAAPADVLASLATRIDLVTPANSLLLQKPLYELAPPQNHPNATFLDANDPDYKLFLLWITNGAKP